MCLFFLNKLVLHLNNLKYGTFKMSACMQVALNIHNYTKLIVLKKYISLLIFFNQQHTQHFRIIPNMLFLQQNIVNDKPLLGCPNNTIKESDIFQSFFCGRERLQKVLPRAHLTLNRAWWWRLCNSFASTLYMTFFPPLNHLFPPKMHQFELHNRLHTWIT